MNVIADEIKLKQDALAYRVCEKIKELKLGDSAVLYYNFPLYRGDLPEDLIQAQLLLASPIYGILYFKCIESNRYLTEDEEIYLDNLDVSIFNRLNKRSELRKTRRELKFNVAPIIVADKDEIVNDKKYVSLPNLKQAIEDNKTTALNDEEYNILLSCIDGTSRLTTKKERKTSFNEESKLKADILNRIQNKEAAFDLEQKKVALVTIDGPQRIRGLAGSGKTIILTMKAALYHMAHPNEEILYTYYTKSLFGLIKNLIERFYRDFADNREPDWKKIHILHGWGGLELGGVYSTACTDNGIEPITYNIARLHSPNPFDYVCHSILETGKITPKYDLTLIDEGQDFPDHFYQLCYALSKEKRIVWAYDDFQNIFDIKLQDEKDTFGKDKDGNYLVDFSKNAHPLQDIVLHTCYRNPRIALIAAFSLGLGIYNTKVLQRLEDNNHWELLGFKVESGESKVGDKMIISRPIEHTPNIINQELGIYTIKVQAFSDYASECRYVAQCITNDIQDQKLRPDDICVICLDNRNIKSYYSLLSKMLIKNGISTFNLVEAPNANKHFFYDNYVTLSTINKAKGNEAGMVYIIGADTIFINRDNVLLRNKLFTAITRTKGWVTITGGEKIKYCLEELNKLEKNDFKLIFTQPSKETTKTIENGSRNQQNLLFDVQAKIDLLVNSGLSVDDIMQFIQRKK